MATPPRTSFSPSTTPEQAEFVSITQRPAVGWNMGQVTPPGFLYVGIDDALLVQVKGSSSAATLDFRGRVLLADGSLKIFHFQRFTPGGGALGTSLFSMPEGFLLNLHCIASGGAIRIGDTFVTVGLARGPVGNLETTALLISGYIDNVWGLGWPNARHANVNDAASFMRSITGSAPGAGAEISETVTNPFKWRPRGFTFTLTTAAAVANREVELVFDDGVNVYARIPSGLTQAASLTQRYSFVKDVSRIAGATAITVALPLIDAVLLPTHRIRTITTNIQGADQYTAPQYLVEQTVDG